MAAASRRVRFESTSLSFWLIQRVRSPMKWAARTQPTTERFTWQLSLYDVLALFFVTTSSFDLPGGRLMLVLHNPQGFLRGI